MLFSFFKKKTFSFEAFAYKVLIALVIVLPVFSLAPLSLTPSFARILCASVFTLVLLVLTAIHLMRTRECFLPNTPLFFVVWGIPFAYGLATLFAINPAVSFFGEHLHMDSMWFVTILALLVALTALLVQTQKQMLGVYLALLLSAILLAILQVLVFFVPSAMHWLTGGAFSVIGSLNDTAVFFGLIILFSLISFALLPIAPIMRGILWVVLVCALFFLGVVNLSLIWWILAFFAVAGLVYSVTFARQREVGGRAFIAGCLLVLLASSFFLFTGETTSGFLARTINVGELEVRPSWSTTLDIGRSVYAEHVLFGAGPGSFSRIWSLYMPVEIQQTDFWQTNFLFGVGYVPTSFITTGLLGALAWLVFFGFFLFEGVRTFLFVRRDERHAILAYIRITAYVGALYVWAIAWLQVPSPILMLFAGIFTGVYIASLSLGEGGRARTHLSFVKNVHLGFAITLVSVIAIVASVFVLYSVLTRTVAEVLYQRALTFAQSAQGLDHAQSYIDRAISLNQSDVFFRFTSGIDMARLHILLGEQKKPEEIKDQVSALLSRAVRNAQKATTLDPYDYQNWITLGTIYQDVIPLGIEGALDSANRAFDRALELRPNATELYLTKATLSRTEGKNDRALADVNKALALRAKYTNAIFFLAQIQLEGGDTKNALQSVQAATMFEPENPVVFFQLGILQYGLGDIPNAITAFEKAVSLDTQYANARYFLALSYWRTGNLEKAKENMRRVQETNRDNPDVAHYLQELEQGNNPFVEAPVTASSTATILTKEAHLSDGTTTPKNITSKTEKLSE